MTSVIIGDIFLFFSPAVIFKQTTIDVKRQLTITGENEYLQENLDLRNNRGSTWKFYLLLTLEEGTNLSLTNNLSLYLKVAFGLASRTNFQRSLEVNNME